MKTYASKDEIYGDYPVAIRLVLANDGPQDAYDLLEQIATADRVRVVKYLKSVENFRRQYPTSVGFFVEVPVKGDTGQEFGFKFILLGHENGPEFFLPYILDPAIAAAAGWIGLKIADKAWDRYISPALDNLLNKMHRDVYGGIRIDHVEIRSAEKGVLALPFSRFSLSQLRCVLSKFEATSTLGDLIPICFRTVQADVTFDDKLETRVSRG